MSEDEIREEIVRLVQQKESDLHDLNCLMPSDFDFVRRANRQVKSIDGDAPLMPMVLARTTGMVQSMCGLTTNYF